MVKEEELRAKGKGLTFQGSACAKLCKLVPFAKDQSERPSHMGHLLDSAPPKELHRILLRILSIVAQHQDLADWISQLRYRPFVEA